jgi:hypothetical protein
LTTQGLVNDIRDHLEGPHQVRALESVFELSRPGEADTRMVMPYYMLVLNTWRDVLPAEQALTRTQAICEKVLREYSEQPIMTKLASVFLGSGGAVEQGIEALEKSLTAPPAMMTNGMTMVFNANGSVSYRSGASPGQVKFSGADLRLFFPESMASWKRPGDWLERLSVLIGGLAEREAMSPVECARVLALTAVHQHALGFTDAARKTFDRLQTIPLTLPNDRLWVWDTAERLGLEDVCRELGLSLLKERHINVLRVSDLIMSVAKYEGTESALALGEATLEYTRHPDFISMCVKLADGNVFWSAEQSKLLTMAENPERYGFTLSANEETTFFRY